MADGSGSLKLGSASNMPHRVGQALTHSGESELLHHGVVDAFLHSCQVSRALQHEIGIMLAGHHVPPRRRQYVVLVLPQDKVQGTLTLGDVPHLSSMETNFVGSFQVDG